MCEQCTVPMEIQRWAVRKGIVYLRSWYGAEGCKLDVVSSFPSGLGEAGIHTALQGMAMGAQANIVDSVHIFIAIAAHKGLAAYALGSSVVDSQVCCSATHDFVYCWVLP